MNTHGRHLLVEYYGCPHDTLNDRDAIEQAMHKAAIAADTTIVTSTFHRFAPQGVSGVVVVEESHLSIHTWPEHGYAAVDFFTCGDSDPTLAHGVLIKALGATHAEVMTLNRGRRELATSIRPQAHYQERVVEDGNAIEHVNAFPQD